jgi:sigma-E processing peptidase SpoIIGA
MKEILYIDVYFALNFAMDLASLCTAAMISSEKSTLRRLVLASFFGASFSAVLALCSLNSLWNFVLAPIAFFVMIRISFGKKSISRTVKFALFSFATSLFLGGCAEWIFFYSAAFGGGRKTGFLVFLIAVLLGFGVFSLWGKHLHRKLETAVVSLCISFCGKNEHFFGLVDSGLLLKDPESGRPVLLLKAAFAESLLPKEDLLRLKTGTLTNTEALFFVPIRTASGKGEMVAFLPDRVSIVKRKWGKMKAESVEILVALDFTEGGYGGCPCLVPLSVI